MCGFSGIVSAEQTTKAQAILSSLESTKHRGVDDTLVYNTETFFATSFSSSATKKQFPSLSPNEKSNIWLGFNRLSIVDLSAQAMQAFTCPKRQISFMLIGEIYNYKQLKEKYLSQEKFQSKADSEVAFRLYLKLGEDFIHHLRGMFAIVVFDKKTQQLTAWRDRFGIKPFYFTFKNHQFIFSSEINGILSTQLVEKTINYKGLAYSMYLGTCPAPLTIYESIFSLEAGAKLSLNLKNDTLNIAYYWTLQYQANAKKISRQELEKDITEIAQLSTTGNVKKAIMLSGGIDSGILAYFLGKNTTSILARSLHFANGNDEQKETQQNAQTAKLPLQFYKINALSKEQIINGFIAEEEPNTSIEPAWILANEAQKENIKVLYSALAPDELFGGYAYYTKALQWQKLLPFLRCIPNLLFPKNKQNQVSELKKYGSIATPFITNHLFSWQEIKSFLIEKKQEIPLHPIAYLLKQVKTKNPSFQQMPLLKQISYLDFHYYIASHHAFRSDRPAMLHSIEMRFPFLDHIFIAKYFNQSYLFENIKNENKPFFRQLAKKILQPQVLSMSKKGFTSSCANELRLFKNEIKNIEKEYSKLLQIEHKREEKIWYLLHLKTIF